jgi:hypothetical protein
MDDSSGGPYLSCIPSFNLGRSEELQHTGAVQNTGIKINNLEGLGGEKVQHDIGKLEAKSLTILTWVVTTRQNSCQRFPLQDSYSEELNEGRPI